jgi:predicted  nucleic acid-binding Zn-ribbon protein
MGKATITERLDKHDREIAAIRKLLLSGMKMLNNLAAAQHDLAAAQRDLAAAQRETDRQLRETNKQLRAFIQSLRRGGNGHSKRRVL